MSAASNELPASSPPSGGKDGDIKDGDMIDILVLDDEESIRWVIGKALGSPDCRLHFADSAEAATELLARQAMDFALVDINLPGEDGLTFLEEQKRRTPDMVMAVITGEGSMNNAITAMKLGAFDYITKPFDIDEIEDLVTRATQTIRRGRKHRRPPEFHPARGNGEDLIVGQSRPIQEIHKAIGKVAPSDLTVLILGESGTGKELIARAIHQHSHRASHPFMAVNCAAIPRDLLESELFGHEKGAFTGAVARKMGKLEAAGEGTLFLDEIGDMPLELQAKLLRVFQELEFQRVGSLSTLSLAARVIAATNQSLEDAAREGSFRHDLYYRINAFTIHAEPLRQMREDIPLLCHHFMRLYGEKLGISLPAITPEAEQSLAGYDWPGNARELENVIKSLMITTRTPLIDLADLPRNIAGDPAGGGAANLDDGFAEAVLQTWLGEIRAYCGEDRTGLLQRAGDALERPLITQVLRETGWNQVRTARVLGINRNTLRTRMQALGIRKKTRAAPHTSTHGNTGNP